MPSVLVAEVVGACQPRIINFTWDLAPIPVLTGRERLISAKRAAE